MAKPRTPHRIGRFAWYACALILTGLAIGTELDFATRTRPALAGLVPEPFRAHAYLPLAAGAIEAGNLDEGEKLAKSSLLARPIPAENASLLALLAQRQGDTALASQALTVAAGRSWRDPVAQTAVIYAALDAQDWRVLAERIDALNRTGQAQLIPLEPFIALLDSPEGRAEIARRFVQDRNWLNRFLQLGQSGQIPPILFGATLQNIHALGGEVDCVRLSAAAATLVRQGESSSAEQLWGGQCAVAAEGMKPGFRPLGGNLPPGPFEWFYPDAPGLSRSFEETSSAWALSFRHRDNLRAKLAERFLKLTPGRHVIRLGPASNLRDASLFAHVRCIARGDIILSETPLNSIIEFDVPDDCPVQELSLRVSRGRGEGVDVLVE